MTTTFFIGDTHFGHKNIITFDSTKPHRPFATIEEHDAELVRRWNSVVGAKDVVYHLGDFCFGSKNLEIAAQLKGDKRLVMGNHDRYPTAEYLKYFTKLHGAMEFKDCVLTHIPVHTCQLQRYRANIHGHMHTNRVQKPAELQLDGTLIEQCPDPRYICVSAEQINLTPVSWDEITKLLN